MIIYNLRGATMNIRFGYVALSNNLSKVTSSSTVTYSYYKKLISEHDQLNKLKGVTLSNLEDLKKIILYNIDNEIHFYRMTSKLIPLATHEEVKNWDYLKLFKPYFTELALLIKKANMRLYTHPDQFDVINSYIENVFQTTVKDLNYQYNLFKALQIDNPKMVIHMGGSQGGKEQGKDRFINNFKRIPKEVQQLIILENDDKVYNVMDTLEVCNNLNIPMVLDIHHHWCNGRNELEIEDFIEKIIYTWEKEELPPKIHLSSPRELTYDRKHADYIKINDFLKTIQLFISYNKDIDIMIEAKEKDVAMFKLIEEIKLARPEWRWKDGTTLII